MKRLIALTLVVGFSISACQEKKTETAQGPPQNNVDIKVETNPKAPIAGKPVEMRFNFEQNGRELPLEISHEKKAHFILVSNDLSWFSHVHPDVNSQNPYVVQATFPDRGLYHIYVDYKPKGKSNEYQRKDIVLGSKNEGSSVGITVEKYVDQVNGYTISLENAGDLKYNQHQPLKFKLSKNHNTLDASILQPYLGSNAHIVIISKEDKSFLHAHSMKNEEFPIYGETLLPSKGWYKMWVQFQISGKLMTASFAFNVQKKGNSSTADHSMH